MSGRLYLLAGAAADTLAKPFDATCDTVELDSA
jgi:hypothetical protein